MLASSYELLSVVVYLALLFVVASKMPEKKYFSIILAIPFIFLSECLVLALMGKYSQSAENMALFCAYSRNFGMLYDGIPWMFPFSRGWFWGIPLLIYLRWFHARSQGRFEKIKELNTVQGMDEIERVKKTRESIKVLKSGRISGYEMLFIFLIFMGWDIAVEYPAIQSGLWSYPYASYTLGGLPITRIFIVGFTGFMLFTINIAIESRNFRLAQKQVKSSSQMPPEIREKSWAWNILVRVISFNIIILSWLLLVFGEG